MDQDDVYAEIPIKDDISGITLFNIFYPGQDHRVMHSEYTHLMAKVRALRRHRRVKIARVVNGKHHYTRV